MLVGAVIAVCALAPARFVSAQGGASPASFPDRGPFLADVRRHLQSDDRLQSQYTFTEHQTRTDFDGNERPKPPSTKTYQVYPSSERSPSYRRLVAVDGVPVQVSKLEEADRKHQAEVQAWVRKRMEETPADRAKRLAKEREDDAREARVIDDILEVYDIQFVGREPIRGRSALILSLNPRPGARPRESSSKPMTKLRGRAWIDEADRQVVRVELEAIDTISFGLGIFARVQKGTTLRFERLKINDEVWLPARSSAHPKARIALLKKIDLEIVSEYSDYRKFTVDTSVTFGPPKRP